MEEYRQWLEQQIERCSNDKDLQREHWAFCKAYEKFTALRQPPVSGAFPSQRSVNDILNEIQRRQLLIKSEPNGIVRETMINNLLIDL